MNGPMVAYLLCHGSLVVGTAAAFGGDYNSVFQPRILRQGQRLPQPSTTTTSIHRWRFPVVHTTTGTPHHHSSLAPLQLRLLSNDYLENDLVAVKVPCRLMAQQQQQQQQQEEESRRLCVVRPDATVLPLCRHQDDVPTDLFIDPRTLDDVFWQQVISDELIDRTYGEGWYGQRPVPSLGGGPGYGAQADEIWSVDESLLSQLEQDNVELPILDVGIAHGEKARGGAF